MGELGGSESRPREFGRIRQVMAHELIQERIVVLPIASEVTNAVQGNANPLSSPEGLIRRNRMVELAGYEAVER